MFGQDGALKESSYRPVHCAIRYTGMLAFIRAKYPELMETTMSIYYPAEFVQRLNGVTSGHITVAEFKKLLPEVHVWSAGDKTRQKVVKEAGEIFLGGRICHQFVTYVTEADGTVRAGLEVVAIFGEPPSAIEGFEKAARKLDAALEIFEASKANPVIMNPLTFEPLDEEGRADYLATCQKTIERLQREVDEAAEKLPPVS